MAQSEVDSAGAQYTFPTDTPPTTAWLASSASPNFSIDATSGEPLANSLLPYDLYTQHYTPLSVKIAMKVLPPLWMAIGIPSNLLCARVWLAHELRHSSSIYLAAIALADLALLLGYPVLFLQIRLRTWVPAYHGTKFYVITNWLNLSLFDN